VFSRTTKLLAPDEECSDWYLFLVFILLEGDA